jgi:hypothetical protein
LIGGRTYNRKEEKKKKNKSNLFGVFSGGGQRWLAGIWGWPVVFLVVLHEQHEDGEREGRERIREKERRERKKNFTNDENLGKKKYIAILNVRK